MHIKEIQDIIDILRKKKTIKLVPTKTTVLSDYSVPYIEPKETFENLICLTGFGHSGSGALLDYLTEFDNTTTFGYHDEGPSGYKKNSGIDEIDVFRCIGGVFDFERNFQYGNYFNDDFAVKLFLHIAQYYYRKGIVYTDKFWELTNDFIDKIVDIKIPVKYGQLGIYILGFTNCWMRKYKNLQSPLLVNHKDDQYIYYLKT